MDRTGEVTLLLHQAHAGDDGALDRLFPMIYDELHRMAHRHLQREYSARTLRTTDLVHEAYLKLVAPERLDFDSRAHFFGASARAMRQILIDYARQRKTAKRGGGAQKVSLDNEPLHLNGPELSVDACADSLLELDMALERLAQLNERLSQIVEYRFFGGLTAEETATVMNLSVRTVKRDWRKARAWLYQALHVE